MFTGVITLVYASNLAMYVFRGYIVCHGLIQQLAVNKTLVMCKELWTWYGYRRTIWVELLCC